MFGSMALLRRCYIWASHAVAAQRFSAFRLCLAGATPQSLDSALEAGKVNALGRVTGALLLAVFALFMAVESVGRTT